MPTSSNILGISDTHNAAAALLIGGSELIALQEERITREKNFSGFPSKAIEYLLAEAGLSPADISVVALAGLHQPPNRNRSQQKSEYRNINGLFSNVKRILRNTPVYSMKRHQRHQERIRDVTEAGLALPEFTEHHSCHAATAYYGWGKYDEPVLVITCDGAGDGLCATVSVGSEGRLERKYSVDWSNSLGVLYAVVTYLSGMMPLEHEYKMMGMAPYAKSEQAERIADKLLALFHWPDKRSPVWARRPGVPHMWYIKSTLQKLFFEERFDAIMAGAQMFIEKMLIEYVSRAIHSTGIHKLAFSGGVFMNVKANKLLMELPEVEDMFVFPSCGDETNAIGACYLASAEMGDAPIPLNGDFYLGPEWDDVSIEAALARRPTFRAAKPENINREAAQLLANGEVVARFAGREEFGARSLGNRAILADPRNPDVIKMINEMIKNRDFWMPFAASIIEESASKYLINEKDIGAPYMILSFDTVEDTRDSILAGTHPYDRTCRPQLVSQAVNPGYWELIDSFSEISGVSGLLNTSLNLHGDPLVHTPDDALDVLERSGLRNLILGNYLVHHT